MGENEKEKQETGQIQKQKGKGVLSEVQREKER